MNRIKILGALALAALVALAPMSAQAEPNTDFTDAWQALKSLAGTWSFTTVGREDPPGVISYHVTSRGSVLFEEFLGETPDGVRNMATAYHLDVDDLVATHYCGARNQPRMKAMSWDPSTRTLRFDFWDITHLADPQAYYTTNIELWFESDDSAELRFRGREKGQLEEWQIHRLQRLSERVFEFQDAETSG